MAKASSPIRLQEDLMQAAAATGKRFHRSATEQIEYWADMGRKVATVLNPDDLLSISSGLAKIRLELIHAEPTDPDEIFDDLESDRANGTLSQHVTSSSINYQASLLHPGYLEQIDQNGIIKIGKFQNGEFIEMTF